MGGHVSRRRFLGATVGIGALGSVGVIGRAAAADPWEQLTADNLREHIGERYTFTTEEGTFALVLQAVAGLGDQPPRPLAFAALLKGEAPVAFGGQVGEFSGPGQSKVAVLITGSDTGVWELIRNSEVT